MVLVTLICLCLLFVCLMRMRASEREKQRILECLEEGVLSLNAKMVVREANYVARKMLLLSRKELIGKKLAGEHPLIQKGSALAHECRKRKEILTDSLSFEKRNFDLIAVPQKRGAILILQDKSAHSQVGKIGKEFISNASHELRTPITIIKGFAETLQDMPQLPREMVVEITEKIVRSCERMNALVKNLLMLADLENLPALRLQECDLVALLENCRDHLQSTHPAAQVEIVKNRSTILMRADPDVLELALMNLLENAVKYSSEQAEIKIEIEASDDQVKIAISDKGIGIPAESLEKIFSRFYTVDKARSRRLGGAGLGLSIVKTIVEKHDGEISATSELGSGTTFTLLFSHLA
jgi:two-component system phosphate regulon sensor histidine kinase PhoR